MHRFTELVDDCTASTLNSLKEVNKKTAEALQSSGATPLVKSLQVIQLQKTIFVVGMFSIFEASLQDGLDCRNGFAEAKRILIDEGEHSLQEKFDDCYLAVNVLKHGRGWSYDALVAKTNSLPFRIKQSDESSFFEGDVAEISTLVEVDDEFVQQCASVISLVSEVIRRVRPGCV